MNTAKDDESNGEGDTIISEHHRVLIAAAARALLGTPFRIQEIEPVPGRPSAWAGRARAARLISRAALRRRIRVHVRVAPQEEKRETPHHS